MTFLCESAYPAITSSVSSSRSSAAERAARSRVSFACCLEVVQHHVYLGDSVSASFSFVAKRVANHQPRRRHPLRRAVLMSACRHQNVMNEPATRLRDFARRGPNRLFDMNAHDTDRMLGADVHVQAAVGPPRVAQSLLLRRTAPTASGPRRIHLRTRDEEFAFV